MRPPCLRSNLVLPPSPSPPQSRCRLYLCRLSSDHHLLLTPSRRRSLSLVRAALLLLRLRRPSHLRLPRASPSRTDSGTLPEFGPGLLLLRPRPVLALVVLRFELVVCGCGSVWGLWLGRLLGCVFGRFPVFLSDDSSRRPMNSNFCARLRMLESPSDVASDT